MNALHIPWLELSIAIPLVGAAWVSRTRDPERAQRQSVALSAATLICALAAWIDFSALHTFEAHDRWDLSGRLLGDDAIVIDELSAPLLSLGALLHLLTSVVTLRTKVRRFSFSWTLLSEAILLATFSCRAPWGIAALLVCGAIPPFLELRVRRKSTKIFVLHMGLFAGLLIAGCAGVSLSETPPVWAVALLAAAVLLRSGVVPVHCWMTNLFEEGSFGTALLFVTPMTGAYAAMRLVLPIAPDWVLQTIALFSLFTAIYAAGMALVQHEPRRFFCYLFLSHASLVLVGLETATPIALAGALSVWMSVSLALTGFGLTLRSMESRVGKISIDTFHGLQEQTPILAALFLLTGLASVGFPGTFGFISTELLIEGAVQASPWIGAVMVLTAAINGIAVLQVYFRIFTGARRSSTIGLRLRGRERFAVLTLGTLILGGGLWPQPGIGSRHHAAEQLLLRRTERSAASGSDSRPAADAGNRLRAPQPARGEIVVDNTSTGELSAAGLE